MTVSDLRTDDTVRPLDKGCFSVISPHLHDDLPQRAKAVMASTSIRYCDTVSCVYHRSADSLTEVPSLSSTLGLLSSFAEWHAVAQESFDVSFLAAIQQGFAASFHRQVENLMESLTESERKVLSSTYSQTLGLLRIEAYGGKATCPAEQI